MWQFDLLSAVDGRNPGRNFWISCGGKWCRVRWIVRQKSVRVPRGGLRQCDVLTTVERNGQRIHSLVASSCQWHGVRGRRHNYDGLQGGWLWTVELQAAVGRNGDRVTSGHDCVPCGHQWCGLCWRK